MLPLWFEDIGSKDILKLVEDKDAERKTLEYKAKININTGDEKAEFLADISSFANASGGDIIFGISDERDKEGNATGVPDSVVPLTITNANVELGRISQIIEAGIQPRVAGVQARVIDIQNRGPVILIRVPKSWNSPHMVTFSNRSRFYSRNDIVGRMQLDVRQIGEAFAAQRSVGERLRAWKADRIGRMIASEGPAQLGGPRLLFHFIAGSALSDAQSLPRIFDQSGLAPFSKLMTLSVNAIRYNVDGLLYESEAKENGRSYLQVFRDGHLEYGDSYALRGRDGGVASQDFEKRMSSTFSKALGLLKQLGVQEPVFVSLTLIDVKGLSMWLPGDRQFLFEATKSNAFDRQVILCPDVLMQKLEEGTPYPTTLLPIVNAVWQAAGMEETPYKSGWETAKRHED